jgi:hypothetical protein
MSGCSRKSLSWAVATTVVRQQRVQKTAAAAASSFKRDNGTMSLFISRKKHSMIQMRQLSSSNINPEPSKGSNLWLAAGYGLLGLVAIDQVLQYYQDQQRQEHREQLASLQAEADAYVQHQRKDWNSEYQQAPSLGGYSVTIIEPSLDGANMLQPTRKGEVVQVVQEHVGPNQAYHLCRDGKGNVGWYPVQFLQPVSKK